MDLQHYVEDVRHQLTVAAEAGGPDATALAERLTAPLDSAIRLALLDALSAAAEEITRELAPASVDLRLKGRDPEFIVTAVAQEAGHEFEAPAEVQAVADDDGGTWRVTLRLPEGLRPKVEAAARREGVSVNAWLVRAAGARVEPAAQRTNTRHHITGWVR